MANDAKVIWISGNLHDRKLTLAKIKGQFVGPDIINIDGVYSVAYLEQIIRQDSVFAEERIVIIRDMPKPNTTRQTMVNNLKKLLEDIPNNCLVVFDGIPADDEKAVSGHVAKIGKLFNFPYKVDKNNAVYWLQGVFKELGKEIGESEAELLIETSGHDKDVGGIGVDLLRLAAQKIAFYVGASKTVTLEDVQLNIFPSEEVVIWNILDSLDNKDLAKCYNNFYRLVDRENGVIGAVNLLYNIALHRYRMLLFLKEGMAQKKSKQQVAEEAVAMRKLSPTGKDWTVKMSQEISDSGSNTGQPKGMFNSFSVNGALHGDYSKTATIELYTRKDIVRIVNVLESGMGELRARSNSESAMTVMADVLFLAVCTQLDDKILSELRIPYGYTQ